MDPDVQEQEAGPARDVFTFEISTGIVEKKQDINVGRTSFAAHYEYEDQYIYVIGGNAKSGLTLKHTEKFDVYNERWTKMPELNIERANPGTFLTKDKRYLYVFQGFQNYQAHGNGGPRLSRALDTIERLDLWNESAGWQMYDVSAETANIENMKIIKPKGCFTMFHMADFNMNSIEDEVSEKSKTEKYEEQKESEMDQIIETPGLKKVDEKARFRKNAAKYNLKDKIIIFGGW